MFGGRRPRRQRFSVSALVPTLFGAPLPIEAEADDSADQREPKSPDWLAELDEHNASEELSVTLYGELEDVLRARITGSVDRSPGARIGGADRGPVTKHQQRRRQCPKVRP
jgi:hypothetical protein